MSKYLAVVGLGSNLDDRHRLLSEAVERIHRQPRCEVVATSPVYETEPVGGPEQGAYLNAATLVAAEAPPIELMDALLAIEEQMGRVRSVRNAPRRIDLDLLWVAGLRVSHQRLVLPHPRLVERPFALQPLLDLCPDAVDPISGRTYASLHETQASLTATALQLSVPAVDPAEIPLRS